MIISRKFIVSESTPVWPQHLPSNILSTEADEAMTPSPSTHSLSAYEQQLSLMLPIYFKSPQPCHQLRKFI